MTKKVDATTIEWLRSLTLKELADATTNKDEDMTILIEGNSEQFAIPKSFINGKMAITLSSDYKMPAKNAFVLDFKAKAYISKGVMLKFIPADYPAVVIFPGRTEFVQEEEDLKIDCINVGDSVTIGAYSIIGYFVAIPLAKV